MIINLILAITIVVLLVKAKCTTNQSPPVSKEDAMDIEMNPNELYAENIMAKQNVMYGVTMSTELDSQPGTYEYVSSQ